MPPPELRFRRRIGPLRAVRAVWKARELVRTLAEREVRARYKQALLGLAWALITPLALMVVFTLFFNRVARVQTGGVPYPLFAYLGLLPWTFFSTSVSQGGQSLIQNIPLLNKVAFPREVFPMASVTVAGLDSAVALVALGGLFVVYTFTPQLTSVWVPLLLLVQVAFTLGVTLIVSAVVVYLRDLRHALPVLLQVALFATPVAYGIDFIPGSIRTLYVVLNPLAAVIDGYRRTVLLGLGPDWNLLAPAMVSAFVMLVLGYLLFKRMEAGFADVA
jgi:ABC-2 type transport system permease protein/lipopolysaccharide transport system permease protein